MDIKKNISDVVDYGKELATEKKERSVRYVKNIRRYGKSILSGALSLVIAGSAIGGIIGGLASSTDENTGSVRNKTLRSDSKDYNLTSVFQKNGDTVKDVLIGSTNPVEVSVPKRKHTFFTTSTATHYNWMKEFNATSANVANLFITNLIQPRSTELDGLKKAVEDIRNKNEGKIEAAGRSYDLAVASEKEALVTLLDKYAKQVPENQDSIVDMPSLKVTYSDGATASYGNYALGIADGIKIMKPGTLTDAKTGASANKHNSYVFELRDDVLWTDGTPTTAADFVFQTMLSSLGETALVTKSKAYGEQIENNSLSVLEESFFGSFKNSLADSKKKHFPGDSSDITAASSEIDNLFTAYNIVSALVTDGNYEAIKSSELAAVISQMKDLQTLRISLEQHQNLFMSDGNSGLRNRLKRVLPESKKAAIDTFFGSLETWYTTTIGALSGSGSFESTLLALENIKTLTAADNSKITSAINAYKELLRNNASKLTTQLASLAKFINDVDGHIKAEVGTSFTKSAEVVLPLNTASNSGKTHITKDLMRFPGSYYQLGDPNTVIIDPSSTNRVKERTAGDAKSHERPGAYGNAVKYFWDPLYGTEINTMCTTATTDFTATTWKGGELLFSDMNSNQVSKFDTIQDMCDSFTLIYENNDGNLVMKFAEGFRTEWLFELLGTSVIFSPMKESHLSKLGDGNTSAGMIKYGDDLSYFSNGLYNIKDISFETGYTIEPNKNNPLTKFRVIPDGVDVRFIGDGAASALTFSYLGRNNIRITLGTNWYDRLAETHPDEVEFEYESPSGLSWAINKFAPELTNNYFRTKVGQQLDWSPTVGQTNMQTVKEWNLSKDGLTCTEETNPAKIPTYPSISEANWICGLTEDYKDYSRQKRTIFGTLFDNGRANYEIRRSTFSYSTETWFSVDFAEDDYKRDYSLLIGDAIDKLKDNPIDIDDASFDNAFRKQDGTVVTGSDRGKVSYYGTKDYTGSDAGLWRSSRKVGFTPHQVLNTVPTPDKDGKLVLTPSFDFDYTKESWNILKAKWPKWAAQKESTKMFTVNGARYDNFRERFNDAWLVNITAATGGDVKTELQGLTVAEGAFGILLGADTTPVINCGLSDAELYKDYNLDTSAVCSRNTAIFGLNGWNPDFNDPTNFYSAITKGQTNGAYMYPNDVPRDVMEWFRQIIIKQINEDVTAGKFNAAKGAEYKKEVNDLLKLAINIPTGSDEPITDLGEMLSSYSYVGAGENGADVAGLNIISSYSRLKILATFEAWLLKEGYMVPYLGPEKRPIAQIVAGTLISRGAQIYTSTYRCDLDTTTERVYMGEDGVVNTQVVILPNCAEYKILKAAIVEANN